ncbi:MAG TPA: PilT/PilU family type 4a pilus ATPase [Kofleriaceae bacterium]|jgi:twitching motility protein PilT
MSAIQSLLRVMTLRDAEAIVLEGGKVPTLRRRGQLEALAMPPLEAPLLAEFAQPLLAGRSLDEGSASALFRDDAGATYRVTLEKSATGMRAVVRPGAPSMPSNTPPPRPISATAAAAAASAAQFAVGVPVAASIPVAAPAAPAPPPPPVDDGPRAPSAEATARLAALLEPVIAIARDRGASDAFLSTGQVRLRTSGRLEPLDQPLDDAELAACVAAVGSNADLSLEVAGVRVRVNAFDHLAGAAIAARLIRDRVPQVSELGLPPELTATIELRDGLVLVCGPTGSGKSTTLAALVDLLDQRRAAHVITLEDPIEYRFTPRRCLVHQREIGVHVPSFAAGLRAALREAPDVILLGELRDRDTIAAALTAAETGHLVLATLHAPSAVGAIDRLIDAFPESQQRQIRWQVAACLRTVVTQFLLPRRDGGRALAYELATMSPAVQHLIRRGDLQMLPNAIQTGRDAGMIPLERSLARLAESRTVEPAAIRAIASDHDLLGALSGKL